MIKTNEKSLKYVLNFLPKLDDKKRNSFSKNNDDDFTIDIDYQIYNFVINIEKCTDN